MEKIPRVLMKAPVHEGCLVEQTFPAHQARQDEHGTGNIRPKCLHGISYCFAWRAHLQLLYTEGARSME